jgi:predicted dehydrogenase
VAAAAATAGKHLFCEKPIATDAKSARTLFGAVEIAGVHHAINFIFPELPAFITARDLVRNGEIGELLKVAVTWHVDTRAYRAGASDSWKSDPGRGGGVLNSFGSHVLHYIEWFLGPVIDVQAVLSGRGESGMSALLRCETGSDVTISLACNAPGATGHRIEIVGGAGSIIVENGGSDYVSGFTVSVRTREGSREYTPSSAGDEPDGRLAPTRRIVSRLLDAIGGGEPATPNLQHGLRAAVLSEGVRASSAAAATRMTDEHVPA